MEQPQRRGGRIAFFGGSFDPPHLGHLAIARAARQALALDTVLFAPVGAQPLKPLGSAASFEDRLAMTRLAIEGESGFSISMADAPKAGGVPNYTLDTLLFLFDQLPPGGQLFCLMGADSFAGLRRWHRAAEIPFAASLIVASRPGESIADLAPLLPAGFSLEPASEVTGVDLACYTLRNARGKAAPFFLLPGLEVDISATQIRDLIQSAPGRDQLKIQSQSLLPAPVLKYIRTHRLYR